MVLLSRGSYCTEKIIQNAAELSFVLVSVGDKYGKLGGESSTQGDENVDMKITAVF